MESRKLKSVVNCLREGALGNDDMPLPEFTNKHHRSIRTNIIERSNREIKHRTRVVSSFSDGNSAPPYLEHRL